MILVTVYVHIPFSEEWKTMSEKLVEANSIKCEAQVCEPRGYHILSEVSCIQVL